MENAEVARMLERMAALTSLLGGNPFKVRAFRQAARVIDALPTPVSEIHRQGRLTELPSIGAGIADKIDEFLRRGSCAEYDQLAARVPEGLLELLRIEGVGPQTVKALWHGLGVRDLEGLEAALEAGRLAGLPGMGPTRIRALREAVERHRRRLGRFPLYRALSYAEAALDALRALPEVRRAEVAGSIRRRSETVGDIDLLVAAEDPEPVMEAFLALPRVEKVLARGSTKSSVRLDAGIQVDLRVLEPRSFGAALHYFTGSKRHNVALRTRAVRRGLKISEYGVFDREGRRLSGEREEEVFAAVGLPWIPPELREGAGEIEAAAAGELPELLREEDIRGDLHLHSSASSDGHSELEELWLEGRRLGRAYLAVTDHSRARPLGLDGPGLLAHAAAIRALSARLPGGPDLLAGVEVDILADGSLDLPSEVLAQMDWVVASIHSRFHEDRATNTRRLIRAIRSGVVDAIGHPTGRRIGMRDSYPLDLEAVLLEAKRHRVALELNGSPNRLDLGDTASRLAGEMGVPVVIDSDAHIATHLGNLRYGVWVARRGWLEKGDVLNTRSAAWLRRWRRRPGAEREVRT